MELPPRIPGFRFDRIVGRGGMSVVWKAYYEKLDRPVAVKVLDAAVARTGQEVRQFVIESRVMEVLDHPGIVHGYEADRCDGRYYFVMDFVSGYTFAQFLANGHRTPEADALIVLDSVAGALDYAWRQQHVVHCDIKPENIMVDGDGTIKVTDLGLCQVMSRHLPNGAVPEEITGTPAYMSPDQIYADRDLDPRTDIYSLGATLYHLTTARLLFPLLDNDATMKAHCDSSRQAPDPRTIEPRLSAGFAVLLAKMCVKDADRRYRNWDEVRADSLLVQNGDVPEPPADVSSIALVS